MGANTNAMIRDMPIASTDLILAVVATWAANHASPGLTITSSSETNLAAIAMLQIGICAFLGFIHWAIIPTNNIVYKIYHFFIRLTKWCSIPYLFIMLLTQKYLELPIIFTILHANFLLFEFIIKSGPLNDKKDEISQLIAVIPLVLLLIQAVLDRNIVKLAVIGIFGAAVANKENIPLFHVIMCAVLWAFESARSGTFITQF